MYKPSVSVIIPSYNRAHLLPKVLPSYFQEPVLEVWVIDDASPDETPEVIKQLQELYPNLYYHRNSKNIKQAAAKNEGIKRAKGAFLYFGDDDSFIIPGTIKTLLDTISNFDCDIAAAKAIYMEEEELNDDWQSLVSRRDHYGNPIINKSRLKVDFTLSVHEPIEVPFAQACVLIKSDIARKILFDAESYLGNGYREETDFLVRAVSQGARLYYNSLAVQINLPRKSTFNALKWKNVLSPEISTIRNNGIFLKKNYSELQKLLGLRDTATLLQMFFILQRLPFLFMAFLQTLFPPFYSLRMLLKRAKKRLKL